MSVKAILKVKGHKVVTIRPNATIRDAVATLSRERIGALVVSPDDRALAGILSERDIIHALNKYGEKLLDLTVEDLMTQAVTAAQADMQIDAVLDLMTKGRFRHMPVVEDGHLTGLVSIGDAVKARLDKLESESSQLREYISGR